jgi:hypothetical protein
LLTGFANHRYAAGSKPQSSPPEAPQGPLPVNKVNVFDKPPHGLSSAILHRSLAASSGISSSRAYVVTAPTNFLTKAKKSASFASRFE